jgi:hypothetical protein
MSFFPQPSHRQDQGKRKNQGIMHAKNLIVRSIKVSYLPIPFINALKPMSTNRKTYFLILPLLLLGFALQAQSAGPSAQQIALRQTDQMTSQLGLSAEQQPLVYNINLKYAEERLVLRREFQSQGQKANRELMMSKLNEIKQKQEAELAGVLTTTQYQSWAASTGIPPKPENQSKTTTPSPQTATNSTKPAKAPTPVKSSQPAQAAKPQAGQPQPAATQPVRPQPAQPQTVKPQPVVIKKKP